MKVTMQTQGADYATPLEPAEVKALGYEFVARYINGKTTHWKVLTPGERDHLFAVGLGIILVFETSAERPLSGPVAGARDGQIAAMHAAYLGYPRSMPIVAAVDIDVTAANRDVVTGYWEAFADACPHPTGVYGDYDIIELVRHRSALNWQANAAWWSRNPHDPPKSWKKLRIHPATHIRQQTQQNIPGVGSLDPNTTLRPFTAWHPTIGQEDNDMTRYVLIELEDADAKFIGLQDSNELIYHVEWTGPGADAKVQARVKFLGDAKVRTTVAALGLTTLHGPLPYGDNAHEWTGGEFYRTVD